jgi:diguanylate cyclase (GGDEF)-like protein
MSAVPSGLLEQRDSQARRAATKVLAILYTVAGGVACFFNFLHVSSPDLGRFLLYLVSANLAVLCLRLTASGGLLSAGFLILLLGMQDLSLPELLFIAATVALLGELRTEHGKPRLAALLFAVANVSIGVASAQLVYRLTEHLHAAALFPAPILAGSFTLLFNYAVASALLAQGATPLVGLYRNECRPLLPWFIAAAYLAYLIRSASVQTGVNAAVLALPVLFALDRGFRIWSSTRADHAAELALLHRRTLETLSVVINARDHTAPQHLRRVQFYAHAIGRELGLSDRELEDLRVATLVYNIGQLGVPDHILLKPGTLTQEEWEKVKTHPVTGSEMLVRMNFPPGVSAIVQTHHEKWDGSGYPAGLKGEEIPIGARILAAVDCLDALASDRPFRQALPIFDAMERVLAESAKSFDPRVVSILERRYKELERKAWEEAKRAPSDTAASPHRDLGKLAARLLVEPDFEGSSIVDPIVSARQETQLLRVFAAEVAQSLRCEEIAAAAHKCLAQLVPYDTLVLYVVRGDLLEPAGVLGRSAHRFLREPIPASLGLSGRVLRDGLPILNGDPMQERSCLQDPYTRHPLQSLLAMPLEGRAGAVGVVSLYHTAHDSFNRDHLRFLKAVAAHAGVAVESRLQFQDAENLAGTDHLTGIANARSLALHLDRELSRASRDNSTIGLLLCDLNGFKQINDRFGHLKGNQVLQEVARGLRETCRGSDYFARLGGDEFVVIVPGLKDDMCPSYLFRLENLAVEAGLRVCGEQCLSVSVGIALYPRDGQDSEALLRRADECMYRAKEQHKSGQAPACSSLPLQ